MIALRRRLNRGEIIGGVVGVGVTIVGCAVLGINLLKEKVNNTGLKNQLDDAHASLTQAANNLLQIQTLTPTPTLPSTELPTATATPSPTETPKPQEWPTDAEAMYQQIYLKESDIKDPAMLADIAAYRAAGVNVIEVKPGDLHKQLNTDGTLTGGWTLDPQRDPKRPPYFFNTVYLVRNSFGHMQYGYMPSDFRQKVGLTENEVVKLGWPWKDENHDGISDFVGSGVPANYAGLVEAITFYPLISVNPHDVPPGQIHELYRVLGEDMQTMDQRLARSVQSGMTNPTKVVFRYQDPRALLEPMTGPITINTRGGVLNLDGDGNEIKKVNSPHHLGGGLKARVTKFTDLPKKVQVYQRNPDKRIRRS